MKNAHLATINTDEIAGIRDRTPTAEGGSPPRPANTGLAEDPGCATKSTIALVAFKTASALRVRINPGVEFAKCFRFGVEPIKRVGVGEKVG